MRGLIVSSVDDAKGNFTVCFAPERKTRLLKDSFEETKVIVVFFRRRRGGTAVKCALHPSTSHKSLEDPFEPRQQCCLSLNVSTQNPLADSLERQKTRVERSSLFAMVTNGRTIAE
jgi:hypothetical protein